MKMEIDPNSKFNKFSDLKTAGITDMKQITL